MPSAHFIVYGDPVPHVSVTYRSRYHPGNRRAKKVAIYKETVRRSALLAKVKLPTPTEERPVFVITMAYFRDHRHGDPESIHKAIKDALWPARDGGDKYTGGSYSEPRYAPASPRVVVYLAWGEEIRAGVIMEKIG